MALSHNRITTGGFGRQQTQAVLPIAAEMAGVTMTLKPNAYREMRTRYAQGHTFDDAKLSFPFRLAHCCRVGLLFQGQRTTPS